MPPELQPDNDPLGKAFTPRPEFARPGRQGAPDLMPPRFTQWPAVCAALGVAVVCGSFYAGTHRARPKPAPALSSAETYQPLPEPVDNSASAAALPPAAAPTTAALPPAALPLASGAPLEAAAAPAIAQSASEGYSLPPSGAGEDAGGLVPLQAQPPQSAPPKEPAPASLKPVPQIHLRPTAPVVDPEQEAHTTAFARIAQNPAPQAPSPAAAQGGGAAALIKARLAQMTALVRQAQPQAPAQAQPAGEPAGQRTRVAFGGTSTAGTLTSQAPAPGPAQAPLAPPPPQRGGTMMGVSKGSPLLAVAAPKAITSALDPFIDPAGRSVVIYLAPWCPWCHRYIDEFRSMRDELNARGIHARIVVGSALGTDNRDFARDIGGSVTVDDSFSNPMRAVPAFYVVEDGRLKATHMGVFPSAGDGEAWAAARY